MVRIRMRSLAASALLTLALAGHAVGQGRAVPGQPHPGPLTSMSAEEQTRVIMATAPDVVTSHAALYMMTPKGYVQTRRGTNGFSCLVEREKLETVEAVCYDAEGSATILPTRLYREELRLQHLSEADVQTSIAAGYTSGRFHAPKKPGLIYMLAKENWTWNPFTSTFGPSMPHYMLYAPYATQESVGGAPGGPGRQVPFVLWPGQPDALIIIMAPETNAM